MTGEQRGGFQNREGTGYGSRTVPGTLTDAFGDPGFGFRPGPATDPAPERILGARSD